MQQAAADVDLYGFPLVGLTPADSEARARCSVREQRRRARWQPYVDKQELPQGAVLKRFCRKGVPHELRGWVWWHVSGAGSWRQNAGEGYFTSMLEQGRSSKAVKQIELDLPRTFPRHAWFHSAEGQEALRQVLTAYAASNPGVGYCQSMNFVVALLLLAQNRDPERAFWLLTALIQGRLAPATYAPNLDGCHVEMRTLGQLLGAKQKALAAHLEDTGCDISLLATDWFLCLFCTSLPMETAARVWDALLCEGPKVLLRVGLAVASLLGPTMLKKDNAGELVKAVKEGLGQLHDRDALMSTAFDRIGSMPGKRIEATRAVHWREVEAMMQERAARTRKGDLKASIASGRALQEERHMREGGAPVIAEAPGSTSSSQTPKAAGAPAAAGGGSSSSAVGAAQQQAWAAAGQVASSAAAAAAVAAESAKAGLTRVYNSYKGSRGGATS